MIDPQQFERDRAKLTADVVALEKEVTEAKPLKRLEDLRDLHRDRLGPGLRRIREAKYAFAGDLESTLVDLGRRVDEAGRALVDRVRRGHDDFTRRVRGIRDDARSLVLGPSPLALVAIKRSGDDLVDLRADLKALNESVKSAIGDLPEKVKALQARLGEVEAHVQRAAGSAVPLAPGEGLYLAVDAEWRKGASARENPDGLLIVTDRRIVMERKEKEGSFLGFGGKKVQEFLWEIPVAQVLSIRPEQRGLLGVVDLIHITTAPESPLGETTVEVKGGIDADAFAAQLRKALDGSLESERFRGT